MSMQKVLRTVKIRVFWVLMKGKSPQSKSDTFFQYGKQSWLQTILMEK